MQIELRIVWTDQRDSDRFDVFVNGLTTGRFHTMTAAVIPALNCFSGAIQASDDLNGTALLDFENGAPQTP